jgi:hypothetical protein
MLARLTGKSGGIKDMRIAEYPGPVALDEDAEIARKIATKLIDAVVQGLTEQGVDEGKEDAGSSWNPRKIVFSGTFDEVNAHFAEQDWSDGMPIVPPTTARVEAFMRFVAGPPNEEIATLQSANLLAVPWNIAVNGVMAGCRPEHMPILVAAARALGDDRCSLANVGSTSMLVPYLVLNGPIVKDLNVAYGAQLISKAPNTAIGRAVGFLVRNIAGFRPGKTFMGTFGYPVTFTLAESGEDSPWEPFHVEQGFDPAASTVTIGVTNNWGPLPSAASVGGASAALIALDLLKREITKRHRLFDFPTRGPKAEKSMLMLLLSSNIARTLADAGYTKRDVKEWLYQNTLMRLEEFQWLYTYTTAGLASIPERVEAGVFPPEYLGKADDMVRLLSSPEMLHIVVCGDPNRNRLMVLEGGHTEPTTKEIVFPPQTS